MFRRTGINTAAGYVSRYVYNKNMHIMKPLGADEIPGYFNITYKKPEFKLIRFFDFFFILNRLFSLGREGYIATPGLYCVFYFALRGCFFVILWRDGSAPRFVDWNKNYDTAKPNKFDNVSNLPEGFVPTIVPN